MKRALPLAIVVITCVLVAAAWVQAGGWSLHTIRSANTAQEAVQALMTDVQSRNWDGAYARLANQADVEKPAATNKATNAGSSNVRRAQFRIESFMGRH